MRDLTAAMVAPLLRVTGFRFDKTFRQANSGFKAFIFANVINTTDANIKANAARGVA